MPFRLLNIYWVLKTPSVHFFLFKF